MSFFYNYIKRRKISKANFVAFFIFTFLSLYFFGNAFIGNDGYKEYISVKSQIKEKKYIQNSLLNKKKSKEEKIIKMRPKSLDIDLLDEEVKKNLGYVNDKEIMMHQVKDN